MSDSPTNIDLRFNEDKTLATVWLSSQSMPVICEVIGIDKDNQGNPLNVYVRNKINHRENGAGFTGWELSGAVTSIFTKLPEAK